jgi:hypothetical protein
MIKEHYNEFGHIYNDEEQTEMAEKMFDKIINFKFLPGGRGICNMGTDKVHKERQY